MDRHAELHELAALGDDDAVTELAALHRQLKGCPTLVHVLGRLNHVPITFGSARFEVNGG